MTASIAILPYDVAAGAEIDITWKTVVSPSDSDISGRKSKRTQPIRNFHITVGPDQVAEVRKIYLAGLGPRWPVGIRDWSDYEFTDEVLTDAGGGVYPLQKKYAPATGSRTFEQRILMPDQSEVPITVKVDGSITTSWTLSDFGKINISTSGVVTASGRFVYPACFADDSMTITVHEQSAKVFAIDGLQLREILEQELINLTS